VITPPVPNNPKNGPIYPTYVPKTDGDGNEIAGIRLPDVTVPRATYTGWALRAGTHANDGCEGSGQMIPLPKTKAERLASNDPRLSIEERYPSPAAYAVKVEDAVEALVAKRLMLREDVRPVLDRLLKTARTDEP
jgi:alpha/beta hydrolase family protein